MTTKTSLKAGRRNNRNETMVRDVRWAGFKNRTHVRAGGKVYTKTILEYTPPRG